MYEIQPFYEGGKIKEERLFETYQEFAYKIRLLFSFQAFSYTHLLAGGYFLHGKQHFILLLTKKQKKAQQEQLPRQIKITLFHFTLEENISGNQNEHSWVFTLQHQTHYSG